MNFHKVKIEIALPVFAGALCSLFFCALLAFDSGLYSRPMTTKTTVDISDDSPSSLFAKAENIQDPVLEYFRDPEYQEWVIDFFTGICSNREIAWAILDSADKFDVPPALAFALSWEESRFNPRAINRQNKDGSVDRGLFQLNNRSFPNLDNSAFFSIKSNVHHGVAHLRYCLDAGGTEVSALAIYNAGTGRVKSTGTPEVTLNYISRILENRRRIETRFHVRLIKEEEERLAEKAGDVPFFSRTLFAISS